MQALLDYERHKVRGGELCVPIASPPELMGVGNQVSLFSPINAGVLYISQCRATFEVLLVPLTVYSLILYDYMLMTTFFMQFIYNYLLHKI